MMKGKKYDWKDSNLALFGSDIEKQVKKESAESEPAWEGAGQEVGLKVWRIDSFEVTEWPQEDYGKFFSGDTYIVLNTYQNEGEEEFQYDVHFWIGKYSTQDEYGTGAYKTVELDTLLDEKPVQHREVMGHESKLFKSYFQVMTTMEGGCASGFNHVQPEEYEPRLLRCRRDDDDRVEVTQKTLNRGNIHNGDVFILDLGTKVYQWNGPEANKDERFKAAQYLQALESERPGLETEVLDGGDTEDDHEFYSMLTGDMDDDDEVDGGDGVVRLYKICNSDFETVKEGDVTKDDLQSDDVFLVDSGYHVFVWVGSGASSEEKRNGLHYAHKYAQKSTNPGASITVIKEGQHSGEFDSAMAA